MNHLKTQLYIAHLERFENLDPHQLQALGIKGIVDSTIEATTKSIEAINGLPDIKGDFFNPGSMSRPINISLHQELDGVQLGGLFRRVAKTHDDLTLQSNAKIGVGETVRLKSGGPAMTASTILGDSVGCVWFVGEWVYSGDFHKDTIERIVST